MYVSVTRNRTELQTHNTAIRTIKLNHFSVSRYWCKIVGNTMGNLEINWR